MLQMIIQVLLPLYLIPQSPNCFGIRNKNFPKLPQYQTQKKLSKRSPIFNEVLYFYVTVFLVKKKTLVQAVSTRDDHCRDVPDTTLLDTRFNQIVIYRIPDSSKFKHKSQRVEWEYYNNILSLKFKQNMCVSIMI